MPAKTVLVRPQGLRPRARAPTCTPLVTPLPKSTDYESGRSNH